MTNYSDNHQVLETFDKLFATTIKCFLVTTIKCWLVTERPCQKWRKEIFVVER